MKHEPKLAIHMEKPLLIAVSWVGGSFRVLQDKQTVLMEARLMESQIWYQHVNNKP